MTTLAVVGSTGQFGGAEATDIHYVASLVKRGVDVRWALPVDGPLRAELARVGVHCEVVASPLSLNQLSRRYLTDRRSSAPPLIAAAAQYQWRLARWLRRVRPEGVLATGFRAQLAATPVASILNLPLAWVASDFIPVGPLASRLWSVMARRVPRVVITYSEEAARQPALRGVRSTCAVLSGVDLGAFPPGPADREPILALVGHLTPLKNHLGFVRVLERVRQSHPDVRGVIAGDAIYRTADHEEYAATVREAAARARVDVVAAPSQEVAALLRRAAVLVHVSTVPETFGRVCAEAMASGAVVVGFRRGATPEVLGDAGLLVAPDDLAAVANACASLLSDDPRRRSLALAARTRVERRFPVERAGREGADAIAFALDLR